MNSRESQKWENRLSIVLKWITKQHGSVPDDLDKQLRDTGWNRVDVDGIPNATSLEPDLTFNLGSGSAIKVECEEIEEPSSAPIGDYLETFHTSSNTEARNGERSEPLSTIKIVDIRSIMDPARLKNKVNLEHRCPNCFSDFSSSAALTRHIRIHHDPQKQLNATKKPAKPPAKPRTTKKRSTESGHQQTNGATGVLSVQPSNSGESAEIPNLNLVKEEPGVRKSRRIACNPGLIRPVVQTLLKSASRKRTISPSDDSTQPPPPPRKVAAKTAQKPQGRVFKYLIKHTTKPKVCTEAVIHQSAQGIPKIQINPNRPKNKRKSEQTVRSIAWERPVISVSRGEGAQGQPDKDNLFTDFPCAGCNSRFTTALELKHHVETVHITTNNITGIILCQPCDLPFHTREALHDHELSHHVQTTCSTCGECFATVKKLNAHERHMEHGNWTSSTCSICGKVCNTTVALQFHIAGVHSEETFLCSICGLAVKTQQRLNNHMKTTHNPNQNTIQRAKERNFKCRYCTTSFSYRHRLREHEARHTGENMSACPYCGILKNHSDLYNHIVIIHRGRKYQCKLCPSKFSLRAHFRNHFVLKHADQEVAMEAGFTLVYQGETGGNVNSEKPPPAKNMKQGKGKTSKKNPRKSSFTCTICDGAVLSSKDEYDLHMLRHEKNPEYRLKHRLPVTRLNLDEDEEDKGTENSN